MKNASLQEFLSFLEKQTKTSFRSDTVEDFLREYHLDPDDFAPYIYFNEAGYGRNLIFRNENCELLALTWPPGQSTPIHDHMGQRCWMVLQTGSLTFNNFEPLTSDSQTPVSSGDPETISAPKSAYIDDNIGLHSIVNSSTKPAVSLHLYAGPVSHCRVFDENLGKFEIRDLNCFSEGTSLENTQSELDDC